MKREVLLAGVLACGLLAATPVASRAQAEPVFPGP